MEEKVVVASPASSMMPEDEISAQIIEEGPRMMPEGEVSTKIIQEGPRMMPEGEVSTQIIEEGPRICPVCSSGIQLFYINYHVKFLMCENTECIFPFGYEELYFEEDIDEDNVSDIVSSRSHSRRVSTTDSVVSTSGWSELERLNKSCESDDYLSEPSTSSKRPNKVNKKMEKEKRIQKTIEDLKQVSLELRGITKSRTKIKNEKWIKNLMRLQQESGRKLVQPQEIENMTGQQEVGSELKIDIEPGTSGSMSSITIEIANQGQTDNTSQVASAASTSTVNVDEAPIA